MSEPKNKTADFPCPDCGNVVNLEEDTHCEKCGYPVAYHRDSERVEAFRKARAEKAEKEASEKAEKEKKEQSKKKGYRWY